MVPLIQKLSKQRVDPRGDAGYLENLLVNFENAQCKEMHDKIYGLLCLANDLTEIGIRPDYNKTLDELFEEVVRKINSSRTLKNELVRVIDRPMRLVSFAHFLQFLLRIASPLNRSLPHLLGHSHEKLGARARVIATIFHVGPPVRQIVESANASRSWDASFRHFYKDNAL